MLKYIEESKKNFLDIHNPRLRVKKIIDRVYVIRLYTLMK